MYFNNIAFSAITGTGRKDVWRAIRDGIVGTDDSDEESDSTME